MSKKVLNYEEAIQELEAIVNLMEKEKLSLKESVEAYKKGLELFRHCEDLINKAESEVRKIIEEKDGEVIQTNFFMEE